MNYGFTCFYNNGRSGLGVFARKIELDTAELSTQQQGVTHHETNCINNVSYGFPFGKFLDRSGTGTIDVG